MAYRSVTEYVTVSRIIWLFVQLLLETKSHGPQSVFFVLTRRRLKSLFLVLPHIPAVTFLSLSLFLFSFLKKNPKTKINA